MIRIIWKLINDLAPRNHAAEWGFAACSLLLLRGSSLLWQGIFYTIFAVTLLILAFNWRSVRVLLGVTWPLLLPVLLASVSVFWSVAPEVSLYWVIRLAGITAFGMFLAVRFRLDDQLRLLALIVGIIACASLLVALLLPEYGVMTDSLAGAWSGVMRHKNMLGRIMALAATVFSILLLLDREWRVFARLGLILSLVLIVASWSRGGLLVAVLCLASIISLAIIGGLLPRLNWSVVLFVVAANIALIVVGGLRETGTVQFAERRVDVATIDAAAAGRVELWAVLLDKARLRPWLGYGYGAFWRGSTGVSGEVERAMGGWYPYTAHNGLLDIALELGIVGVMIFLVPFVIYGRQALIWGIAQRSLLCLWPLLYLVFLTLSNLVESDLIRKTSIYWVLYVAAVVTLQRERQHSSETRISKDADVTAIMR